MSEPWKARYERGISLLPSASIVSISTAALTVPEPSVAARSSHRPLGRTRSSKTPAPTETAWPMNAPLPAAKVSRPSIRDPVLATNGPCCTGALVCNSTSTSVRAGSASTAAVCCPLPPTTVARSTNSGVLCPIPSSHAELTFERKRYFSTTASSRYSASLASLFGAPSRLSPYPLITSRFGLDCCCRNAQYPSSGSTRLLPCTYGVRTVWNSCNCSTSSTVN